MDLSEKDLHMFFKPYQYNMLKSLWAGDKGLSSREVWDAIDREKSRASVINSLEAMVKNGLLDKHMETGKGGHHGIYSPRYDEPGTREYLKKVFTERLNQL